MLEWWLVLVGSMTRQRLRPYGIQCQTIAEELVDQRSLVFNDATLLNDKA